MTNIAEGIDLQSADHDGDGLSKPNANNVKSNYLSRFIEVSRFTGAPAQGAFYASNLDDANTSEEVTADIQIGNVIGNGVGLFCGLALHYLARPYYRTGSHEILWVEKEPSASTIKSLGLKGDGAYVRHGNKLYYVNNINKKCHALEIEEKEFASYYEKMTVNSSKIISPDDVKKISLKIPNHAPVTGRTSTNPLYRNFKTLANFGWQVGATISNFLGIEDPNKRKLISSILSDICCFVIGLFAIPYWLIREKVFKIEANSRHKYAVTGSEGWSKYARTALAFGISVGQAVGGFFASIVGTASSSMVSFSISFWGGIVGVASFIVGLIAVPLINWATSKGFKVSLAATDEKITADKIPKKTIILKNYNGQIKAYYVKGGKLAYPVDLRLTAQEIQELQFPKKAGDRLFMDAKGQEKLIDTITSQCTLGSLASDDKNYIRNNYTRSGMVLGAGIGACLGLIIGNWCFGIVLGGIIFSALGSVVAGAIFSFTSHKLHRSMHPIPKDYKLFLMEEGKEINPDEIPDKGKKTIVLRKEGQQVKAYTIRGKKVGSAMNLRLTMEEIEELGFPAKDAGGKTILQATKPELFETIYAQTEDLENSWDYVTRSTASLFGFIGAAIVCLINPAAALLLVPIGTAIAGAIGWGLGLLIMRKARHLHEEEQKAETLPWTQRITTGANIGSIIGGAIGIAIGFAGFIFAGPASVILAVSFFGAIGAIIGGIAATLWDKTGRTLVWEGIKSFFGISPKTDDSMTRQPSSSNLNMTTIPSRPASPVSDMNSTAVTLAVLPNTPRKNPAVITKEPEKQLRAVADPIPSGIRRKSYSSLFTPEPSYADLPTPVKPSLKRRFSF